QLFFKSTAFRVANRTSVTAQIPSASAFIDDSRIIGFSVIRSSHVPQSATHTPSFEQFQTLASTPPAGHSSARGPNIGWAIPVYRTLLADHLTPVTAYERLVRHSAASTAQTTQHAFLLESVVGGERIARHSFLAAHPRTLIKAHGNKVTIEE